MSRRVAITTVDNPYDPIDEFKKWYGYDNEKGYDTSGYLARLVHTSENLGPKLVQRDIEEAIDEMIAFQIGPKEYKKVVKLD